LRAVALHKLSLGFAFKATVQKRNVRGALAPN